jgi:hypothetical protein
VSARSQVHDWSSAIGTALVAGYRWLDVYCPGCRQVKLVDPASVDIIAAAGASALSSTAGRTRIATRRFGCGLPAGSTAALGRPGVVRRADTRLVDPESFLGSDGVILVGRCRAKRQLKIAIAGPVATER